MKHNISLDLHLHLFDGRSDTGVTNMAIRMPRIIQARQILKRSLSNGGSTSTSMDIPKGYFAIYVEEKEKKRFVVPISILSEPRFQKLLHQSELLELITSIISYLYNVICLHVYYFIKCAIIEY
ncbi:putative small auxin-up RNA [Helianthus debilis subsp. tardiflorus]